MRGIYLIVVHCSDSPHPTHDNIETIRKWHVEERGWADIGYHFVITKDGVVHKGRPIHIPGAHVKGHNKNSIGICLTGQHHFSNEQLDSLKLLCEDLIVNFGLEPFDVVPHNVLDKSKTCPNFNINFIVGEKDGIRKESG